MEFVRSTLAHHAYDAAANSPVFSRIVRRDDLELLDSFRDRLYGRLLLDDGLVLRTIVKYLAARGHDPVQRRDPATIALESKVRCKSDITAPRRQIGQDDYVASRQGKVHDRLVVDGRGYVSSGRVGHGRLAGNGYGLVRSARLKREVDTGLLSTFETDTGCNLFLESGKLHRDRVHPRGKLVDEVLAPLVGKRLARDAGRYVEDRHIGSWDHRSRRIDDCAEELTKGGGLTEKRDRLDAR